MTQPLHSAVPRSLIPKNLAGIIHSETVKLADEKLAVVERLAREAGVQVEVVRQSNDHPWEAIVHTAKEKQCDLIVMASHGRRGVSALVLGSETQKVLTHSTVPVWSCANPSRPVSLGMKIAALNVNRGPCRDAELPI